METFTLAIWLVGAAIGPPAAEFKGLSEMECLCRSELIRKHQPKTYSQCVSEYDPQRPAATNPVARYCSVD